MAGHATHESVLPIQSLNFLRELLADCHPRNFEIELWDGTRWAPEPGQFRRFTWKINRPGALRRAFSSASELALGEAYIFGDFDIDGDIEGVFPLANYFLRHKWSATQKLQLASLLFRLPLSDPIDTTRRSILSGRLHSKRRDRQAIQHHYDVSNDFYALWLGSEMVYSCAYFQRPNDDLNTAQAQKLDYICRKLRLRDGDRLLDIGCGWGGLILHAVRHYGVRALGITLSESQLWYAKRRIVNQGLSDRCEVRLLDYRELDEPASFDKVASVGMVEHVGEKNLAAYFESAYKALKPGGTFLSHGIGVPENRPRPKTPSFGDLYVFPDGELIPVAAMAQRAEHAGFEVRDVENLREHYALTLRHWVRAMQAHCMRAHELVDDTTYRIWRLHMAGSAYYFQAGLLDLYQMLLVKPENGKSHLPLTRADWYR